MTRTEATLAIAIAAILAALPNPCLGQEETTPEPVFEPDVRGGDRFLVTTSGRIELGLTPEGPDREAFRADFAHEEAVALQVVDAAGGRASRLFLNVKRSEVQSRLPALGGGLSFEPWLAQGRYEAVSNASGFEIRPGDPEAADPPAEAVSRLKDLVERDPAALLGSDPLRVGREWTVSGRAAFPFVPAFRDASLKSVSATLRLAGVEGEAEELHVEIEVVSFEAVLAAGDEGLEIRLEGRGKATLAARGRQFGLTLEGDAKLAGGDGKTSGAGSFKVDRKSTFELGEGEDD